MVPAAAVARGTSVKKYGPECITHSGPSPCISNKSNKHHRNRLVYLVYVFMEIPEMLSSGYSQP